MQDPRKRDLLPTVLDFGPVRFILARHFGFLLRRRERCRDCL